MEAPPSPELDLDNLEVLKVLGKGAMGTVFLVKDPTASRCTFFALKLVDKASFVSGLDAERRARWEIQVLARLSARPDPNNPFFPRLLGTLDTREYLAWALPYCPGGDLNALRHTRSDGVFSLSAIRFYLAEILCSLDYLHSLGIVYRDLKPENILVQHSGHVTLTDFDLSRSLKKTIGRPRSAKSEVQPKPSRNQRLILFRPPESKTALKKVSSARVSPANRRGPSFFAGERSNSFVGTDEYVSPEMLGRDGHEFAVDWWALGVLAYEMMYGRTPFKGKNRKETFRNILVKEPDFRGRRTEITDLIRRLLEKDPTKRLGYDGGAAEIKEHLFFGGVKWDLLTEVMRPPYIPSGDDVEPKARVSDGVSGLSLREYLSKTRSPASPCRAPTDECHTNLSFEEYY